MKTFNSKIGDSQLRSHCIVTKQLKAGQTAYELHVIMLGDEIIEFVAHCLLRFLKYLRWALLGHGPYLGWVRCFLHRNQFCDVIGARERAAGPKASKIGHMDRVIIDSLF